MRLPNLVIAGVVKAGTTSVYSYLSLHPDICCSTVKETCYFSYYRYGQWDSRYENSDDPFEQYRQYFCQCEQQKYVLEATPGYFEGGMQTAQAIKNTLGDNVKIMIVLREPISRLISFFKYKKSMLELDQQLTLAEYLQQCQSLSPEVRVKKENDTYWGIEGGFYANYLEDWFNVFGDSIYIAFFDELKNNPKLFLSKICTWLELDSAVFESQELTVENKSLDYKNKYLQQLALFINFKAEKFWRANSGIKRVLRSIYYNLNSKPHQEEVSQQTLNHLQSLYLPYNQKLAAQLLVRNYTNLPQWLLV
ncbi:MAG: sulfotransferase domain-containing protein [Xenococcaceae cyanobacterium MO_207.B15]|nr:sulfotransferase domain-containing protein [Xenococcaceae cyanobacterium MO_207.B15]